MTRRHLAWLLLVALTLVPVACRPLMTTTPSPAPTVAATATMISPTALSPTGTPVPVPSSTSAAVPTTAPTNTLAATAPPPTVLPATATPKVATPAAATSDADGAVQVILDYWGAVNNHDYVKAYGYWADNGAASKQTYQQFVDGFADTVQAVVQFGAFVSPEGAVASVTLPVTLTAVSNVPNDQIVQYYHGSYTLQTSTRGWQITSARIVQIPNPSLPQADLGEPTTVLQSYFDAINRREYARAYTYWEDPAQNPGQTYAQFHQGFATTKQVNFRLSQAQVGGAAGSIYADVPALLSALQSDNSTRTYCGTYTLRRANVPPFDRFGWHIQSASVAQSANVQLDSAEAERLLTQGCK